LRTTHPAPTGKVDHAARKEQVVNRLHMPRIGEEQLVALIQESLSVAHKTGAIGPTDLERVVVDTTVQPKAVAHPTDARLMHRAII
jgi:hypothetical protein